MSVKAWAETVTIPTYEVGKPDKNPMFFEKRVYQGSSGMVYPNPIIEKIYDEKVDKEYKAVFLENKYLKIMILPELGGRVQMAYDKLKDRHFIYYNQVIKPALVGLCGPWISGGIEFNWPQHHRPSTFDPVEYAISENEDGSKTIWVNEIEKMFHTKGMAGFTLYPDKAYLEIKAKLINLTSIPQTFLWWANPAVKVHDDYQSVFPPDVNAVFDHGKRDVSSFPIAKGTYYKVDYSPGTDISKYKNIPVPTSYMAINSKYNFVGGYEHDIQAGMLHVADHHVSPGKKQWTWGNGDFGLAWDRNLTDEDGPYIELMAGVFTDNQPDFAWLKPFEEKTFTQYFLPYRELGVVKNASKNILLSLDQVDGEIVLKVFVSSNQHLKMCTFCSGILYKEESLHLVPEDVYIIKIPVMENRQLNDFSVSFFDDQGQAVLSYDPMDDSAEQPLPEPAKPALLPHEIENNEQLFLTGQHLEQYRHATYRPMPYYLEGIKRDPNDIRCNNAVGAWYLKRGMFQKSIIFFEKAVSTITSRNPNPYNCEPYFNLGQSHFFLNDINAAYDAFFKATWDNAFQDTAYYLIAQIDLLRGNAALSLEHIDWALDKNARNGKAYHIKILALEKLGQLKKAEAVCALALERDMFNLSVVYEQFLFLLKAGETAKAGQIKKQLLKLSGGTAHNAIEYAIDYIQSGLYQKAIDFIGLILGDNQKDPLVNYYLAYTYSKLGNEKFKMIYLDLAFKAATEYCFPNRLYDVVVLTWVITSNETDSRALYYLGNLFYDKQQYELAIDLWEQASLLDKKFPTIFRNLGLAYYNKMHDSVKALEYYEIAYSLDKADTRVLMELDSLYKKINKEPNFRLDFLTKNSIGILSRDDLYLEMITLNNFLGNTKDAFDQLMSHKFHPWEGGEGKVSEQYKNSLIANAKRELKSSNFQKAIDLLEMTRSYPENLGEGKLVGTPENDIFYWFGCAYEGLGDLEKATNYWTKATAGSSEPGITHFYNDQQPDKIFYQGCSWIKLGKVEQASHIFQRLVDYGEAHIADAVTLDYFAVSLPDLLIFESDLSGNNIVHCKYISALGYMGLSKFDKAIVLFEELLQIDKVNYGSKIHLETILQENPVTK
ncbi:DUF5107 domain-containing protein [Pedobacter sp. JCM 36344]|uniref:DUF5107 domain-containing protein n=1 Tax=Pedobacter sp. JCM 36344 TaxID=3374280 RepID=UPI00397E0B5F